LRVPLMFQRPSTWMVPPPQPPTTKDQG
jgi:hypothetical protein